MSCGNQKNGNANAACISDFVSIVNKSLVSGYVDEYRNVLAGAGVGDVTVETGRKYAVLRVGATAHSVVDLDTGLVHLATRDGKPWRNMGTLDPMYDLNDPEDKALLFQRLTGYVRSDTLGKRPWAEREAFRKAHPLVPAKKREKRDPGTPVTSPMSPKAVEYLRLLGERKVLWVSVPGSESWSEGSSIPSATARGLVERGYAVKEGRYSVKLTDAGEEALQGL